MKGDTTVEGCQGAHSFNPAQTVEKAAEHTVGGPSLRRTLGTHLSMVSSRARARESERRPLPGALRGPLRGQRRAPRNPPPHLAPGMSLSWLRLSPRLCSGEIG